MAGKTKKKPLSKAVRKGLKTSVKPVAKSKPGKTAPKKPAAKKVKKTLSGKTGAAKKPVPKKIKVKTAAKKPKARKAVPKKSPPKKPVRPETEEERKAGLRKLLLRKRADLLTEIKTEISKYIKGETRQLVDTALDDGDWSVVDLSEDISLRHLSAHRETLMKIDESLRKLNEGTYGLCEDCGDVISEERLKILPFAIYCIDCQERREKIEEMEKRQGIG